MGNENIYKSAAYALLSYYLSLSEDKNLPISPISDQGAGERGDETCGCQKPCGGAHGG